MSNEDYLTRLAEITEQAKAGVDYSPQYGAICPACDTARASVVGSLPWEGGVKIRYHRCRNMDCPLCQLKTSIKSIEEDLVHG